MFTIKICGITRPEDAQAAAAAGADAIGLNFYGKSPRFVDADRAREIIATLPPHIVKVGVFVNAPLDKLCRIVDELSLDLIQIHGDESPEYVAKLGGRPAMKGFGAEAKGLSSIIDYLNACRQLGCLPRLVLIDAPRQKSYGGSGKLADWTLAREYLALDGRPPLVLAGGLRPENVADAIRATDAQAVDAASGVESRPGIKDSAAIAAFVAAAKSAFRTIDDTAFPAGQVP
jgi:phosphoribosylanthranilate isomerase